MNPIIRYALGHRCPSPPWDDCVPIREELFGIERLEQHAQSLAIAQEVTLKPIVVMSLQIRLNDNANVLLAAYHAGAAELENGRPVVHAAEWLLDNYHLVEEQVREIREDLPPGYYRQLPKLASGPFAGYPRVFGIAWAFVAHTDSHFDPDTLRRFIAAYQSVQALTIGELWAIAITLRIVLIENLRRLADQITIGRSERAEAETFAASLLETGHARAALDSYIATRLSGNLSELFAAHLAKRLRDQDPRTMPALAWLEERLKLQGVTVDQVVQHSQQRQGASNVSVRNVITSMRLISDIDWAELFESVSLIDKTLSAASQYGSMDFATRNLYRSAIEQLARGSIFPELEIARMVLDTSRLAGAGAITQCEKVRFCDPGYHLIAEGRPAFEKLIGFRPTSRLCISRFNMRLGIGGYVGAIFLVTALFLFITFKLLQITDLGAQWQFFTFLVGFIPASQLAIALVDRAITWSFAAMPLAGLELAAGVPETLRTLVAVPTILSTEAELLENIERLEVHYLSGASGHIYFALLADGADADEEHTDSDTQLLKIAFDAIAKLNIKYQSDPLPNRINGESPNRFLFLHRRRVFNAGEGKWMGWERKRGKLHELNRLLRGAVDTTFSRITDSLLETDSIKLNASTNQPNKAPVGVRYVITLDADTRLPRDAATKLIGKMAHPLNQPTFCEREKRIIRGYGILQPRVTPSLPIGREGSFYQRTFSAPGGMDPYAAAISDVYQDLFGEGSYTGKGIYDVDAFEAALAARIPENTMLSHDLFEGVFVRAGLASDIEVVEESPSRYDVSVRRQHRWTRGDWQLLPWIFGKGTQSIPLVGRWKMIDNLRRSMLAPFNLFVLVLCWLLPMLTAIKATLIVIFFMATPSFLPAVWSLLPRRSGFGLSNHVSTLISTLRQALYQSVLTLCLLPDQAMRMSDAILRTGWRLLVSHRHLLEWTTAAQAKDRPRLSLYGFYQEMACSSTLTILITGTFFVVDPASWPVVLPFALLWLAAPAIAFCISRSPQSSSRFVLTENDARYLRLTSRRTWRYFETFVTPLDNMLPPDNFQEAPKSAIAHRTSPTNIGLYLLSTIAARDFGWVGTEGAVERLERTFATMDKMARFKGHFFNWYDTKDLRTLDPPYVSSVDSGNLAGHLIVVANACDEWNTHLIGANVIQGINDNVMLARDAIEALPTSSAKQQLISIFESVSELLVGSQSVEEIFAELNPLTIKAMQASHDLMPSPGVTSGIDNEKSQDVIFWVAAFQKTMAAHNADHYRSVGAQHLISSQLTSLAKIAREMALAMDFAFLLEPDRKLLSIGYDFANNRLDPSCYDLLASEARLASLFAIAKGDVSTKHWFRLGRTATPLGKGSALISWSGSMFEYLMPSLVMRAPIGSLLEQTNRLIVARQEAYGLTLGIPWGVSESAYNARDVEFTYQYSNFGVPGLGLKRGLSENIVIAPYATGLATMVDPGASTKNYERLASMGALGEYGFYEALDFTKSRVPENEKVAIVRSFMAHHQGMTIVSIANTLQQGLMRSRFHREPMIQACELLLHERMPRDIGIAHPRAEEVKISASEIRDATPMVRRLILPVIGAPVTHVLSNGRYAVLLTDKGAGYSSWLNVAVTRWREDATQDDSGYFIFLRDIQNGAIWTAGSQVLKEKLVRESPNFSKVSNEVNFSEDHAEFIRHDGSLMTRMDVLVSGEDDGEVRLISLTNGGSRPREIEVTTYSEIVLTTGAADRAHPAFAKMFVVTEHLPEYGALIATRRPRSNDEPQVWAAHFAVIEGDIIAEPQYESDRNKFIKRGNSINKASAIVDERQLSNTVGTILDPIFALRYRLRIPAGKIARLAFWTVVASSRLELLDIIDRHQDRSAFDRARTLAWTQAQVQLRYLDVTAEEAASFQDLATPLLYSDHRFRVPREAIERGAGPQSGLWAHSISGDLPIVLLRIDETEDIAQLRQLLRAHQYWRMKSIAVDLVIINERASSYTHDLQVAIDTAVRTSQARRRIGEESVEGTVYTLRADLMSIESRMLIHSIARISLTARRGMIADQLALLPTSTVYPSTFFNQRPLSLKPQTETNLTSHKLTLTKELEFFNGLGGFDKQGREYVTVQSADRTTPAPWINVIANESFGFQVSADGSGYTWSENSKENQLTQWSNDPVIDPSGELVYIRDEETGELWSPTAKPQRDGGTYISRHGFGYSAFEHAAHGVQLNLLQYVPLADPIKISRLTVSNVSGRNRKLSVTFYTEWVLGTSRGVSAPFNITELDEMTGAIFARNPWSNVFSSRVAFADMNGKQTDWTADRTEFLGRNSTHALPLALGRTTRMSGNVGAGYDPCAAQQQLIEIGIGETVEIVYFLGQCTSAEQASALIMRYRAADLDAVLKQVTDYWQNLLEAIQVKTPDRAMDIMLNGWLLYQTVACRIMARSAFYQASGAYGFRDQLQDGMALTFASPEITRKHILKSASRQFIEGDVQHWWLPHSGQGVRTKISDDRVWLAYATATYIKRAADAKILEEEIAFLEGPVLHEGEHDAFFQPMVADESATLYEHCARGLDQSLTLIGGYGLPLIGSGDWNDGMSRVGEAGRGESVWLAWLLVKTLTLFVPFALARNTPKDSARTMEWQARIASISEAIEANAWDGEWYRRATFDDGTWLGSKQSDECRIDSIAQSWALISGIANAERASQAMASLEKYLILKDEQLALLFTPPFDKTKHDPGYIKGYPPGLRENGGQYSHAAMWAILAYCKLGLGNKAVDLFSLINPINHALTPANVEKYKVEPYVIAADVYSVAPHEGRGGWTWYTGSAGWMYQAGVEGILGIRREGSIVIIKPCIPLEWPEFDVSIDLQGTHFKIKVRNLSHQCKGVFSATLNGKSFPVVEGNVHLVLDGGVHELLLSI